MLLRMSGLNHFIFKYLARFWQSFGAIRSSQCLLVCEGTPCSP